MFQVGYANLSYFSKIEHPPSLKNTKVKCGRSTLESALGEELYRRGLKFPEASLSIDKQKREISIRRRFASSQNASTISYSRLYPPQEGFEEMMEIVERMLGKPSMDQSNGLFLPLSNVFKRYLVENLDFTEKATFSKDTSSRALIHGTVGFGDPGKLTGPAEFAEYSISLTGPFVEKISEAYREDSGRDLSARRRKKLAMKEEPLGIDAFLRALDIRPATSKYQERKDYENLRKCTSFLIDVGLRQSI